MIHGGDPSGERAGSLRPFLRPLGGSATASGGHEWAYPAGWGFVSLMPVDFIVGPYAVRDRIAHAVWGALVTFHDPLVPTFCPVDAPDCPQCLESMPLDDALAAEPDCAVIITAHRSIDWEGVFKTASLVVDTCNISARYPDAVGRILRLGAGWSD